MTATIIQMPLPRIYGATPADWSHLATLLGLTADLLPVVSNPHATISAHSTVKDLGKTPTRYNGAREVVGIAKWSKYTATTDDIDRWQRQPDYGICLQTRHVRALDIDVADPARSAEIVAAVANVLGFTPPVRRRPDSGKCLLALRVPGEYVKRVIHVDGGIVENLNNGQQFIAVGTHPGGQRYAWDGGLPSDFPTITPEQYERIWDVLTLSFALQDPSQGKAGTKSEKLTQAHENDPVVALLYGKGLVHGTHPDGRLIITCPFDAEHTTPADERDTSTVYWPALTGGYLNGHFHCLHAHCEHRTDVDFQQALGYEPELESFDALIEDTTDADDFQALPDDPADAQHDGPEKPAPLRFPIESLDTFAAHPPQPWIIKGVLPQAGLGVIYGESGSGKSFFTLDLGAAIARGISWRDRRVRQGRVVYIVAEGAGGFRNRVKAYCAQHGTTLADIPFGVINDAPNLIERKDAVAVAKSILLSGGASVIVVDTLAQTTPGANENSGEDMGQVLEHCRQIHRVTGALVLLVHHSGKDASKGARGWSGLRAACDVEIEITRNESLRTARVSKQKDGEDGLHWNFTLDTVPVGLDEDGDVITSCLVNFDVPQEVRAARKEPTTRWRKGALAVVQEFSQDQLVGIEVEAVITECLRRTEGDDIVQKKRRYFFRQAVAWLAENDYFDLDDTGCISISSEI